MYVFELFLSLWTIKQDGGLGAVLADFLLGLAGD